MMRRSSLLVLTLHFAACHGGVEDVPLNGSFEKGRKAPEGWELSGGHGAWEEEGRTGKRCISVTGDGESSNYWTYPAFKLDQWQHYRIDFWTKSSPDARGGSVISGTNQANMDWLHAKDWTHRTITFRTTYRHDRAYLRFGQRKVKGTVYFDDIRVTEVRRFHSWPQGVYLGEGETIRGDRYQFVAPLDKGLNCARVIDWSRADFNSNRWLLNGDVGVEFRHVVGRRKVGASPLTDARVEVDVGHYVAGRCVVEVGSGKSDAKGRMTWVALGEIDGKRSAEFRLPSESHSTKSISVRLVGKSKEGEAKPCSLQVNGYKFTAKIDPKALRLNNPNLTGTTCYVREEPVDFWNQQDFKEARRRAKDDWTGSRKIFSMMWGLESVGTPALGGRTNVEFMIGNGGFRSVRMVPVIEIDGVRKAHPYRDLPRRGSTTFYTPYDAGGPGPHWAIFELLDGRTSETLYRATWDYTVPAIQDSVPLR